MLRASGTSRRAETEEHPREQSEILRGEANYEFYEALPRATRSNQLRWCHLMRKISLEVLVALLAAGFAILPDRPALATAGIAEWEIVTPGGNWISHIDPLKERHGTCLRKADDTPGVVVYDPARVYVEQLEWWQYYSRYVVGKAGDKLFVFEESTHTVHYFITENELDGEIKRKGLGQPVSERKTPADGWNEAWMPTIRERCAQFEKGGSGAGEASESVRAAMRRYCDQAPAR